MVNNILVAGTEPTVHAAIETLRRLTDIFGQRRRSLAASCGLTEHQWHVLEEIATEHFMPSMFARERESSAAAVSKVLRQLIDKNLISVSVSPADGRQRQYELTSSGKSVMKELRRRRKRAIETLWSAFPPETLDEFTRFGASLAERMEAYEEEA